jgi:hypothetical protein
MRLLREVVAATIAVLIVGTSAVMLYIVFTRYVPSADPVSDKHFERAKDLLLFLNPLLGVVIGYYFNKVSTEARAEKAEATVETATNTAQEAKAETEKVKSVLNEVIPAAQEVLNESSTTRSAGTLSVGESASAATEAQAALRAALQRARQIY